MGVAREKNSKRKMPSLRSSSMGLGRTGAPTGAIKSRVVLENEYTTQHVILVAKLASRLKPDEWDQVASGSFWFTKRYASMLWLGFDFQISNSLMFLLDQCAQPSLVPCVV
jgi:hypothetical protein